jgi:hypothetical protein
MRMARRAGPKLQGAVFMVIKKGPRAACRFRGPVDGRHHAGRDRGLEANTRFKRRFAALSGQRFADVAHDH